MVSDGYHIYRVKKMLLPGDLESPGLNDLMAEEPYDCDVLMAPHHGSRGSDPPGFAAWCTPEYVVFSSDARVPADVERTYAQAGARVFTTGKVGMVELSLSEAPIQVSTWLPTELENNGKLPRRIDAGSAPIAIEYRHIIHFKAIPRTIRANNQMGRVTATGLARQAKKT